MSIVEAVEVEKVVSASKAELSKRIIAFLGPLDDSLTYESYRKVVITTGAFYVTLYDDSKPIVSPISGTIEEIQKSLTLLREQASIELEKSKVRRAERLAYARQIDALFVDAGTVGA